MLDRRQEFVEVAGAEGRNMALLCRRFGISRKTGYKWLGRYRGRDVVGIAERLSDRSRRPKQSHKRTSESIEQQVVALRKKRHWGGRKPSTITGILRRATGSWMKLIARRVKGRIGSSMNRPMTRGRWTTRVMWL